MGFANKNNAFKLGREGSVGKDLGNFNNTAIVLTGPSRERP
jgi:hypothetical protein